MKFRLPYHPQHHSATRLHAGKYPQSQKFRKHLLVALQVELAGKFGNSVLVKFTMFFF